MSILLIGCGYWGRNWAKALAAINALAAICEPDPAIRKELGERFPGIHVYADVQSALMHAGLEGAVIATPVPSHHAVATTCLNQGLSVLVEKPLALDVAEAEALVALAQTSGRVLAVGHLLLYHPALLTLKGLIDRGELGDILAVQCTRMNLGKVRNEESVWWSFAPHDLSILHMLLGEPLTAYNATKLNTLGRPDIEDTVYAAFSTPSGREASIHVSWLSPAKRHETVVIGTRQIAVFEDTRLPAEKLQLIDWSLQRDGDAVHGAVKGETRFVTYEQPADDLLTVQARAFIRAVRSGEATLPNGGEHGLQVVRLLNDVQALLDRELPTAPLQLPL